MALEEFQDCKSAGFVSIGDLQATEQLFLRTVGYTTWLDSGTNLITLEYNDAKVLVDVSSIHPFKFVKGAILQVMGHLEKRRIVRGVPRLVIRAQIHRDVTDLDINLYHSMQQLRQQYKTH